MKRAMGLTLAVLTFAIVAHADGIEYGRSDLRSQALSVEALESSNHFMDLGSTAFRTDLVFLGTDDAAGSTDYLFYSHFGDSEKAVGGPIDFDSIRLGVDGPLGTRHDERGGRFGIVHPEPFHRILGVQEIPEPGTVLLLGVGLTLMTVWKRSSVMHVNHSDRVR